MKRKEIKMRERRQIILSISKKGIREEASQDIIEDLMTMREHKSTGLNQEMKFKRERKGETDLKIEKIRKDKRSLKEKSKMLRDNK